MLFQIDGLLQEEEGHVVAEVSAVEVLVALHARYTVLFVWEDILLAMGVPLTQTNRQLVRVFSVDDSEKSGRKLTNIIQLVRSLNDVIYYERN